MELIKIPEKGRLDKEIPISKFCDEKEGFELIEKVCWRGVIKPGVFDVAATVTDTIRYEEIQFLKVYLKRRDRLYDVGELIFSKIKYPCIIEFVINDVVIIGVCKFEAGKIDKSENVNRKIRFSHILRKEILSSPAVRMIEGINDSLISYQSIEDMYNQICFLIREYQLSGTSRAHFDRLIDDMLGKVSQKKKEDIRRYCVPYEYHRLSINSNRYQGKKDVNFTLVHDYEEMWYCLMKCQETKNVIERRRYRDINDLVYSIDSKNW